MRSTILTCAPWTRPRPALRALIRLWRQRRRSRIALARLDPYLLCDCGLSEAEARRESARPFWRG